MNLERLCNADPKVSADYLRKKFKSLAGPFYPRSAREKKCVAYYLAAEGPPDRQDVVETVYQEVFKQLFPIEKAEREAAARAAAAKHAPRKLESSAWLAHRNEQLAEAQRTRTMLGEWKRQGEDQMGEAFMPQLKQAVAFLDEDLMGEERLETEFEAFRVASLTSTTVVGDRSARAEFDAMIGFKQRAAVSFETSGGRWGEVSAKLEESFRAGAWASGSAGAAMKRLGFSADMQVAIAIGAQLTIEGDLTWKKGAVGLQLAGSADVFAGAKAEMGAKFSAHALRGIELSLEAGAFAGFKAEATGTCAFTYRDQKLVSATGTVGVAFGAGAEFSASIKAPIFGPTEISFGGSVALLTGATSSTAVAVNFGGIYLAGKSEFQRLMYLPTIARGYKQDLMTQDATNRYYLNKCLVRLDGYIEDSEAIIASYERTPVEKRSLLMNA